MSKTPPTLLGGYIVSLVAGLFVGKRAYKASDRAVTWYCIWLDRCRCDPNKSVTSEEFYADRGFSYLYRRRTYRD